MTIALGMFFIVAAFGAIMRLMFVVEIPFFDYKNILHAHSHLALLGWGFLLVSCAMIKCLPESISIDKYRSIHLLCLVSSIGMTVSYVLQGYGFMSIFFSILQIIIIYLFLFRYYNHIKNLTGISYRFFKWSLIWLVVSTLGLINLGFVSAFLGNHHILFYSSVQFFLHFQFNGWFTYAMLGILFHFLNKRPSETAIPGFVVALLHISLFLTYALSVTWSNPLDVLFHLNTIGVLLQLLSVGWILQIILKRLKLNFTNWPDILIFTGIISLAFKIVIQAVLIIPDVAIISYTIRNYVVAFIHLIMLGSITLTISGVLIKSNILGWNNLSGIGWKLLFLGFVLTEFVLFGQGTLLWMRAGFVDYYYETLLSVTLLLNLGIILVLIDSIQGNYNHVERNYQW